MSHAERLFTLSSAADSSYCLLTVLSSHGDIVGPGHMAVHEEEKGVYM